MQLIELKKNRHKSLNNFFSYFGLNGEIIDQLQWRKWQVGRVGNCPPRFEQNRRRRQAARRALLKVTQINQVSKNQLHNTI